MLTTDLFLPHVPHRLCSQAQRTILSWELIPSHVLYASSVETDLTPWHPLEMRCQPSAGRTVCWHSGFPFSSETHGFKSYA